MGRSRSRTRSFTSNRRLRSDSRPSPKSVAYTDWSRVAPPRSSPYSETDTRWRSRPHARPFPGKPSRMVKPVRPALVSPWSKGVWAPVFTEAPKPPRAPEVRETMVCVRRQQRREVLHAFGQTGKAGQKPPVNNRFRKVRC